LPTKIAEVAQLIEH